MNPDDNQLTDALRDGIDRMTEKVSLPPSLVGRAHWHRSRQHKFRRVAGSAAAVAGVVGLIAATLAVAPPELPGALRPKTLTVAYVTSRVEQAMGKASTDKFVEQVSIDSANLRFQLYRSLRDSPSGNGKWAPGLSAPQARMWLYRDQFRTQGVTATGKTVYDVSGKLATVGRNGKIGRLRGHSVDYQHGIWWQALQFMPADAASSQCGANAFPVAPWRSAPLNWTAMIRSALKCGSYKIARHQQVDGQPTIKLIPARHGKKFQSVEQTLWVAPSSYLPVRVKWNWALPDGRSAKRASMVADFAWRTPSKASIALLHAPVPAGFRKLGPTMLQIMPTVMTVG